MNCSWKRPGLASFLSRVAALLLLVLPDAGVAAEKPPVSPIGLDAYRQWERWPYQRVGVRAYMRSTYDRRGGNESADASHFLYQLADDNNVTLDVAGPGILYFARYNHWHGSPWRYVVDGMEHIVQESSTSTPNQPVPDSVFLPREAFPQPLAWTWSTTKGADLIWTPIAFERSFRMGYSRTCYGTGYYIYHQWVPGTEFSQPLHAWDGKSPPDSDVVDLLNRSGTNLLPPAESLAAQQLGLLEQHGNVTVPKDAVVMLHTLEQAPAMLRALEFSVARGQAIEFGRARLRITWDGRPEASVDAPVALFFGAGTLYNREGREYLVKAFPVNIRFAAERVHLACFFPMPFFKSARIELIGSGENELVDVRWSLRHAPLKDPPAHVGYFHATYRDHREPVMGEDLVLLDTRGVEGSRDWTGSFIGTSFTFSDRAVLETLEGDPRFFFDDSLSPQAYGTGTEEWGGGGDYWGGRNMTLPFAGHPVGARNAQEAKNDEDKIQSAYRFLLADLMPFGKNALIRLEHGGENQSLERYRTVTYWYGRPGATLRQTDSLKIGDLASERSHDYVSPDASAPYEILSRYEWGVDSLSGASMSQPRSQPRDFAEFEFQAEAGQNYTIWVRGVNLDGKNDSDASWLQFDNDIGTTKTAVSYTHPKGFGNWLDRFPTKTYAWSSALPQDPPRTITFNRAGPHRLRLQPRHPGHRIEQIWLSTTQKELPDPEQMAAGGILLKAADAVTVQGQVKLVDDPGAVTGKAMEVQGEGTKESPSREIYPAQEDAGRKTAGTSEFNLQLDPQNLGVLLRRKLDYSFPNQRAEIYVADARQDKAQQFDWKPAGVWYLAGGNTCVYSRPKEELGATLHIVQTSNRRFRDDEFLLPRNLTTGREAIRIRVKFTPVKIPLFPGRPLDELAWSEIRYDAYCFVLSAEQRAEVSKSETDTQKTKP